MNNTVKRAWVTALRSGEYSQGKGQLRDAADNFCCLGVLCDLHSKETGTAWELDAGGYYKGGVSYLKNGTFIPSVVSDWAGLGLPIPRVEIQKNQFSFLHAVNDKLGWNFNQIADIIEEQL